MKKILLFTAALILISIASFSQDFITYKGAGKIILNTGDTIKGNLSYSLTFPRKVRLVLDGKDENYNYDQVKEFFLDNRHYITIKTRVIGNPNTFALLMGTETDRIRLFKYEQQPMMDGPGGIVPITTEYYVSLPGEEFAMGLMDMKLIPFNKKMAKVVEGCPALAKKIADKEDGYKMGLISNDLIRLPVYQRIAAEFEQCK